MGVTEKIYESPYLNYHAGVCRKEMI